MIYTFICNLILLSTFAVNSTLTEHDQEERKEDVEGPLLQQPTELIFSLKE